MNVYYMKASWRRKDLFISLLRLFLLFPFAIILLFNTNLHETFFLCFCLCFAVYFSLSRLLRLCCCHGMAWTCCLRRWISFSCWFIGWLNSCSILELNAETKTHPSKSRYNYSSFRFRTPCLSILKEDVETGKRICLLFGQGKPSWYAQSSLPRQTQPTQIKIFNFQ